MSLRLVVPAAEHLAAYLDALRRGWYPNTTRPASGPEELQAIARDAAAFLATQQDDPAAKGPPITLADGSQVPRLPSRRRWIWDGEFCGSIQMRWQEGTHELPPYCLGHIGYSVVPWKQRRGYATRALALMVREAKARGLPHVEITTAPANIASQKVILANGGVLVEEFEKLPSLGGGRELRFRIG